MTQRSPSILLLALLATCSLTLAGCQVADAWRERMGRGEALAVTDETSDFERGDFFERGDYVGTDIPGGPGFRSRRSTDQDVFNEYYDPYAEEPGKASQSFDPPKPPRAHESGRFERLVPPLVPPSRSESLPSMPNLPLDRDVKQSKRPTASGGLMKSLRSPGLFTPGGARSMYDRLRGQDEGEDNAPPLTGPIARLPFRESAAQACVYSEVDGEATRPVTLGLPEPVIGLPPGHVDLQNIGIVDRDAPLPALMQATPSSFKHPLLADPTGVPYPNFTDF